MKLNVKKVLSLFTFAIALSLTCGISAKAASGNFAIGGYPADVKTINVGNRVTSVQGYQGMSFNDQEVTITIPSVEGNPSYVEAYYYYKNRNDGTTSRGTIYITIYYKSDEEPALTHTSAQDALSDQYRAYLKTLDSEYPAGYRFTYLASGQRALILVEEDYLSARLTHKGNTLATIRITGTDGIPRKMLIQDIHYEMDQPYIGLYVNNEDGQKLSYQISDADLATLKENGYKGIYLNKVITDFE